MADVDVAVIGSGAGGLTAALALAQAGLRVVVFEQHYVPGGWCHSFKLGGYQFSPGVHYIGELGPGGRMRRIYEGLGVADDLAFFELHRDGYDHVLVGGERFDIPAGFGAFADRLKARFPSERRGIDGYLGVATDMTRELDEAFALRSLRDAVMLPLRTPTLARWGLASLQSLLDHFVRDPTLKAILAAQCGDHGLPPSLAPAPVHCSIAQHYFNGGYYPAGGAFTIPRAFTRALKKLGAEVRLRAPVDRILLEGKRAVGVRLADGTEVRARYVVSNADADVTYNKLLGKAHLPPTLRWKLARTRWSVSALSLFLAADVDPRAFGLDSGNYWYYRDADVDGIYRAGMRAWGPDAGAPPGLFLTVTTLKDPARDAHRHHTMEAFAFIGYDAFKQWAETTYGKRPEDYEAMKKALTDRMLEGVERVVPGLRDRVRFAELGTPLTNVHYVAATNGSLYGPEKSRWQVGPWAYPVKTSFPGLYHCGASTVSHGVAGVTISGLVAAASLLRCPMDDLLRARGQSLATYPTDDPSQWPEAVRARRATPAPDALHA